MYPILIPIKKNSTRLKNKNHDLIKYTLNYVEQYGRENIYILTDDEYIINEYGKDYNIIIDEDKRKDVIYSVYSASKKLNTEYVFYLCVTNPFRENGILYKMINKIQENKNTSIVTTKIPIPNRKIFLIDENDKFKYKSKKGRKGKYVKRTYMIDGSAYLANVSFLKEICNSDNPNKLFWESNFKTVINHVPFMDIDVKDDMDNFNFIVNFN